MTPRLDVYHLTTPREAQTLYRVERRREAQGETWWEVVCNGIGSRDTAEGIKRRYPDGDDAEPVRVVSYQSPYSEHGGP